MVHSTDSKQSEVRPIESRLSIGAFVFRAGALVFITMTAACDSLPSRNDTPNGKSTAVGSEQSGTATTVLTSSPAPGSEVQMITSLVDALVQLHPPFDTTVQVSNLDSSTPGTTIVEALSQRGFGIQRVDADLGANLLRWDRIPETGSSKNSLVEWRIAIGTVAVKRSFEIRGDNQLAPASPLILSGTRKLITLDDTTFSGQDNERSPLSTIEFARSNSMLENLPTISLITDDVIKGVNQRAVNGANARALNSSKVEVNNLFSSDAVDGYGGVSAFTNIRDNYVRVRGETVIFADDSMRLGPQGKQQVEAFLENYQPNVDLIGLIGCSNGPTNLVIGNEGLALGRSERIAEELLALGVPRESILDEGCWSETSARGRFPGRGVVLELLRRPLG